MIQLVVGILLFYIGLQILLHSLSRRPSSGVSLNVLLRKEHEGAHRESVQAVVKRTVEQFGMDPGAPEDSKRQRFDFIQRNLVMRLRYADAPGETLIRWTLWDGSRVEYKLKEAVL
jgi:hypothetical protein